jgi:hypothetical protein
MVVLASCIFQCFVVRLMYDNLQETQANKGERNKYNLIQPMQMIKEKCNKDNQIKQPLWERNYITVLMIMKRDYNQSCLDVVKLLPTSSLLQYPQCIHEIHHHQLTPLAKIEFLKAKELLTIF